MDSPKLIECETNTERMLDRPCYYAKLN